MSKIKVNVEHAGLSQQLAQSKVHMPLKLANLFHSLNNS
jgi:hypothetical protein